MGAKFSEEDLLELAPPKRNKAKPADIHLTEESTNSIIDGNPTVHDVHNVDNVSQEHKESQGIELSTTGENENNMSNKEILISEISKSNDIKNENIEESENIDEEKSIVLNPDVASDILNNNPMNIKFNYRTVSTGQGKKGQKVKRINMSFTDDIYLYISTESRKRGMSSSVFVNTIIAKFMKDNAPFE